MKSSKIVFTSAFRQSLIYMALFALSVVVLLGFLYWNTVGFLAQQTDRSISAEVVGLDEQFRRIGLRTGPQDLQIVVRDRSRRQNLGLYQLRSPEGFVLEGNLGRWPNAQADGQGWLSFTYEPKTGDKTRIHQARARVVDLPLGYKLLVGRDTQGRYELQQRSKALLAWVIGLTLLLGMASGYLTSRSWLRRVDTINETSHEIMAGDLSRRIPLTGKGDELDALAGNLNRMLDEIQNLLDSLRQVTDNVAHDLRTPLNRLRGRLEIVLMGERPSEEYRREIEAAIGQADELLGTFNAMLTIAEAESSCDAETMTFQDVAELARHVADFYAPLAEREGLRLDAALNEKVVIRGNPQLLSQVFANLLDNAIKYTSAPGAIAIHARSAEGAAELIVRDTGPGIPESERKHVLKRFYRLDSSRQTPGNGLGLSLVATVARIHGANLSLEDANPGLLVRMIFPAAAKAT